MEKVELVPGVIVYKNVMPQRQQFIDFLEEGASKDLFKWNKGSVINEYENKLQDVTNTQVRDVDTFGIPYFGELTPYNGNRFDDFDSFVRHGNNMLFETLREVEMDYKREFHIDFDIHDSYQILRYGKGHFFHNHMDDCEAYHRRISYSYYLNDDYVGGEIEFPRFNLKIKPQAGDMVVFPSNYPYAHTVHEVTEGVRYTVVNWIH
jgi:hypothetical protein